MYDIYKTEGKRPKTYIVTKVDEDYSKVVTYAKRYFKCSEKHIEFTVGYLVKDLLYIEEPESKKFKKVGVAYWVG